MTLFGAHGLEHVTIDEIMEFAGLTRGGFYRHFATKEELFVEAMLTGIVAPSGQTSTARDYDNLVRSYLAASHLTRSDACPLFRFPESAARGTEGLRSAYTSVAKSIAATFAGALDEPEDSPTALTALALCVGGMVIARGVNDPHFADAVRQTCIETALSRPASRDGPTPSSRSGP